MKSVNLFFYLPVFEYKFYKSLSFAANPNFWTAMYPESRMDGTSPKKRQLQDWNS